MSFLRKVTDRVVGSAQEPVGQGSKGASNTNGLSGREDEEGNVQNDKLIPRRMTGMAERSREAAAELATTTRRQLQRSKLMLEVRRLESKLDANIAALGQDVFPLVQQGALRDEPVVQERMQAIAELQVQLNRKQLTLHGADHDPGAAQTRQESMDSTDYNATDEASDAQSVTDAEADASENPAEQGGQG